MEINRERERATIAAFILEQELEKGERAPIYSLLSSTSLADIQEALESFPALTRLRTVLANPTTQTRAADSVSRLREQGIECIPLGNPLYPALLTAAFQPPLYLLARGKVTPELATSHNIAVIGSRRSQPISSQLAKTIGRDLAEAGAVVVSGLAYGIDAAAHRGALESKIASRTIAVLGNPIDTVYPASHRALAEQILEAEGVLLSTFLPGSRTHPSNFLSRNRIIAGMSSGVIVIQAAKDSGSLATARYALEEGRDIFVTPGQATDPAFGGSHHLIQQGAMLITASTDVIRFYEPHLTLPEETRLGCSPLGSDDLLGQLSAHQPTSIEDLRGEGSSHEELMGRLLALELSGAIVRLPGNTFILARPG